jgi:formate dehydrogenase major subunit/formate dehydrogenase alpha subunit
MLNAVETGQVRCLYVIGENPMTSDPDLNHVKHALRQAEFMVLQEIFPSETAQYADVILPAASWAEKEGTFTNTERRIQRVRKAVPPPGEAQLDSWIVTQLAKRMLVLGAAAPDPDAPWHDWEYTTLQDVIAEINALTPIYAGVSYERIEGGSQLQWPVRGKDHPGTPVLHVGQFSRGLGRFIAADHIPPAELPDTEYPLLLTTGRVIYHWHGAEMTRRASGLNAVYPEALIEVSPKDAQAAGVLDGDLIKLESRRGEIVAKAQVTTRVGAGLVFATFHFPESAANFLTIAALDPTAKIPEFKVCAVKMTREPAG